MYFLCCTEKIKCIDYGHNAKKQIGQTNIITEPAEKSNMRNAHV